MKLEIDGKYQIVSDSMQYILQEKKTSKSEDGESKEYHVNVSYHGKIYQALQNYKEIKIRGSSVTTVKELMKLIKSLDGKIETLLGGN